MFLDEAGLRKVFDLQSPHQMLEKLRWETGLIHSMLADDRKVIFAAFNAAATAWHLTEWIIEAWDDLPAQEISKGDYRGNVVQRCPDLEICRQISVGWKHRVVKQRNDPAIQASHMIFRMKDGKITDGPPARVETSPVIFFGTKHVDLDAFDRLVTFWADELGRLRIDTAFTVQGNIATTHSAIAVGGTAVD